MDLYIRQIKDLYLEKSGSHLGVYLSEKILEASYNGLINLTGY